MAVGCAFQRNRRSDSRLDPHDEGSNRAWNEYVASGPRHRARRIKALRPLLLDTTWRPKDMGIYGDMWSVHANARGTNYLRQEERARKFIKTLAQCTASQTHKALQALLDYDAHHVDDKCGAGWDLSWAMLTGTSLRAARKSTDACILWIQIVWYGVHAIAFVARTMDTFDAQSMPLVFPLFTGPIQEQNHGRILEVSCQILKLLAKESTSKRSFFADCLREHHCDWAAIFDMHFLLCASIPCALQSQVELLRAVAGLLDGQGMKSPESMQRDVLDIQGTPDLFG